MRSSKLITCLVLICGLAPFTLLSQDIYTYTTKGACHGLDNGRLELELIESEISSIVDVSFPISIYVEDLNDESVEWLVFSDSWQQSVDHLYAGDYRATVDLNSSCSFQFDFFILASNISIDDAFLKLKHPSTCSSEDGDFRVLSSTVTGGVGSFNFTYTDFAGQQVFPNSNPDGSFRAGTYYFVATDEAGCSDAYEFKLDAPYYADILMVSNPTCSGQSNGSVGALLLDGANGEYEFSWSNGIVETTIHQSEQENLPVGNYCVTITSTEDPSCNMYGCAEVEQLTTTIPLSMTYMVYHPCPNQSNGHIIAQPSGGIPPYIVKFNGQTLNHQALPEGIYVISIEDACGNYISSDPVTLTSMTADASKVAIDVGCLGSNGKLSIEAEFVSHGNTPYSNLERIVSFNGPYVKSRHESLIIQDARGCNYQIGGMPYEVLNNFARLNPPIHTCDGINTGKIKVELNGNMEDFTLEFDNINLSELIDPIFNNQVVSFENLPSADYSISVDMSNCALNEILKITGTSKLTNVFNSYDMEEDLCMYDEFCNGELITSLGVSGTPFMEPNFSSTSSGAFGGCGTQRKCLNSNFIVDKTNVRKVTLPWWQYVKLYFDMLADPRYLGILALNTRPPDPRANRGCRPVSFCPVTMEISRLGFHNIGNRNWMEDVTYDESTGCFDYYCLNMPRTYCYDDVLSDVMPSNFLEDPIFETIYGNCTIKKENAYQLLLWRDQMMQEYEDYDLNTELSTLLDNYEDLLIEGNEIIRCSDITFCLNNFNVLLIDFDVECQYTTKCEEGYYEFNPDTQDYYWIGPESVTQGYCDVYTIDEVDYNVCASSDETCFIAECSLLPLVPCRTYIRLRDYEPGILENGFSGNGGIVRILSKDRNQLFSSLQFNNSENGLSPYTTYKSGINEIDEYFSETSFSPLYKANPYNSKSCLDFSSNNHVVSYNIDNKELFFGFIYDLIETELSIKASDFIKVKNVLINDSNSYVIGSFAGHLTYNNQTIEYSLDTSDFILQIDMSSITLINQLVLSYGLDHTINFLANPAFTFLDPILVEKIKLNQMPISLDTIPLAFNLYDFNLFNVRSDLQQSKGRLIDVVENNPADLEIFKNEVFIDRGEEVDSMHVYTVSNSLSTTKLLTAKEKEILIRRNQTTGTTSILMKSLKSMELDGSRSIEFNNNTVIIEFDSLGFPLSYFDFQLGVEDGFSVEDLFLYDSIYYFAGDVEVTKESLTIGDVNFIFHEWHEIGLAGFTSTVKTSSFTLFDYGFNRSSFNLDPINDTDQIDILFYPNPFHDVLQMEITNKTNAQNKLKITMQSILGTEVLTDFIEIPPGTFRKNLPLNNRIPNGVYLIKVFSDDKHIETHKLVKS